MRTSKWQLLRLVLAHVRNWPIYFLNRYGVLRHGTVRYRLHCGVTVLSRPFRTDGSALNDVWLEESYDPNHFGIPFDWNGCRTVVDVGANIGTFTLYAAHRSPQARIVSVEPEPSNVSMLKRNVEANRLQGRVSVVEAGIAEREGAMTFHVAHKNSGGHSLYAYTANSHPITVRTVTLRRVLEEQGTDRCDYLKLDCEGGEYEGLYSLTPEQLRNITFMAIEYHYFSEDPRHTPDALRRFLVQHGLTVREGKKSMLFAFHP